MIIGKNHHAKFVCYYGGLTTFSLGHPQTMILSICLLSSCDYSFDQPHLALFSNLLSSLFSFTSQTE
jgi:hypothetical protein